MVLRNAFILSTASASQSRMSARDMLFRPEKAWLTAALFDLFSLLIISNSEAFNRLKSLTGDA